MGNSDISNLQFKPRNMSPEEELKHRLSLVARPERLSDANVALLLNHHVYATVKACKLIFTYNGEEQRFWSEQSLVCHPANNDKKFLCHWVLDFPDMLFVMTGDLKMIEAVPREGTVKYFDQAETGRHIAASERYLEKAKQQLTELQKTATVATGARRGRNKKKIADKIESWRADQLVQTFSPVPSEPVAESPAPEREISPRFESASSARTIGVRAENVPSAPRRHLTPEPASEPDTNRLADQINAGVARARRNEADNTVTQHRQRTIQRQATSDLSMSLDDL